MIVVAPAAGAFSVDHTLRVDLSPETHALSGIDEIVIHGNPSGTLTGRLSPKTVVRSIQVDGLPAQHVFRNGTFRLQLPETDPGRACRVVIDYGAVYDDPVPLMPANTDNPGYGVTGTISERGTFLLPGAGWYPDIENATATYTLHLTAPQGVLAVTAGRSLGHATADGHSVSTWRVDRPVEGLALSAARYVVNEKKTGRVTAATYFLAENSHLSADYLDATLAYIAMYSEMFGPYPFEKFAVVENFFPTGFGFPSYTLMGGRVLRLPFIIRTSLGHEIAHCWWGNGVVVDVARGNWCEGLTAYVADYLYKERMSPAEALDQRRQLLRNYADLVDPARDFPLSGFRGRHDRVTGAVGYDKAAMVFHMLRQQVGDAAFWASLRDIYRERLFEVTSWDDLKTAFERRARTSLDGFFHQWISRPGAMRLSLGDVSVQPSADGWTVSGRIDQQPPHYQADIQVAVETDTCVMTKTVAVSGAETPFDIAVYERPLRMTADPDYNVFRRLYPSEIPPSVNALKGSEGVMVIAPPHLNEGLRASVDLLIRSLGIERFQWVDENLLTPDKMNAGDLLYVGFPDHRFHALKGDRRIAMTDRSFNLNGTNYGDEGDVFFGVFDHPEAKDKVAAVFLPVSGGRDDTVARKITHYGKYSYLAFSNGLNRDKGVWPATASPLIHNWQPEKRE